MDNENKTKYELERERYEYNDLIKQIEKLVSRIDYLYDEIKEQGITIPERKKDKIENFVEKIRAEEISSLRLISNYKEEIIKILEGLFKVSYFAQTRNNIVNALDERRERKEQLALEKEREKQEREMEKERLREEREQEKQRKIEEKEALAQAKLREKEERILQKEREKEEREQLKQKEKEEKEALIFQKQKEKEERALAKEREKEELAQQKLRDKEEKEALPLQKDQGIEEVQPVQEPQQAEETTPQFTMGGIAASKPPEEKEEIKEEIKEEEPALAAPSVAYYSPKEDTIAEEPKQQITPAQSYDDEEYEEVDYMKYLIPILAILFIGFLFFLIWTNFDSITESMRFASDKKKIESTVEKEPVKEAVIGLANCFPELTGSQDSIDFANKKLNDAYYCCFENRITQIDPDIFAKWKKRNYELIKCITENIPDDYMLVVVGHANKTGYEEDMKVYLKDLNFPKLVVGNYSYSMNRAKSLIDELNSSINKEMLLYYGVGSTEPRTDEGISPQDHLNRRITFKIMKKDRSEDESEEWIRRKEEVRVVK